MRILQIGYRLPPFRGGKERHIDRLSRTQVSSGHDVVVAHRLGDAPAGTGTLPLSSTALGRAISWRFDVTAFAIECAHALSRADRFDIIHLHGDHREALALAPSARRLGIPLVITVHGALTTRHRRVMPLAFRRVGGFIAMGKQPTLDLRAVGVPAHRILTMSNGLDLSRIAGFRREGTRERGLLVSVASLERVKNHELTIRAFHELRTTHPESRLVIIGGGSERDRLEQLAGTGSGVEFTGDLPAEQVYATVARAAAFVLASRTLPTIGEGIPTAALEALALGTPVIVSSDASLDPIVKDQQAYRTFRTGSRSDLLAHMRSALRDDLLTREDADRRIHAVAHLDWPLVAERIEKWYETVLAGTTGNSGHGDFAAIAAGEVRSHLPSPDRSR